MARQFIHNFLTVDPGVNTGWAYWGLTDNLQPMTYGVFRAPGPDTGLEQRLRHMYREFQNLMGKYKPNFVVIEGAEDWGDVQSRLSSASGALQLLSFLVGGYAALSLPVFIIKMPREWKGGLPKKALELRIARALGQDPGLYPEHAREAVGIGLSMMEVL